MEQLFKRYIDGFAVGELPRVVEPDRLPSMLAPDPERLEAAGYVRTLAGEWVHNSEAVLLPQGGRLVWARM